MSQPEPIPTPLTSYSKITNSDGNPVLACVVCFPQDRNAVGLSPIFGDPNRITAVQWNGNTLLAESPVADQSNVDVAREFLEKLGIDQHSKKARDDSRREQYNLLGIAIRQGRIALYLSRNAEDKDITLVFKTKKAISVAPVVLPDDPLDALLVAVGLGDDPPDHKPFHKWMAFIHDHPKITVIVTPLLIGASSTIGTGIGGIIVKLLNIAVGHFLK